MFIDQYYEEYTHSGRCSHCSTFHWMTVQSLPPVEKRWPAENLTLVTWDEWPRQTTAWEGSTIDGYL